MGDAADLCVKVIRGKTPFTEYRLRATNWNQVQSKMTVMAPLPGDDSADGEPRRLGLDFGGIVQTVILYGRVKRSDLDSAYEPTKHELEEVVRRWWADGSPYYEDDEDLTSLYVDDRTWFKGSPIELRLDKVSGQDDWWDFVLKFAAKTRCGLTFPT